MSDPGLALMTFAITVFAVPLTVLAAWNLFKGLLG